MGSGGRRRKLLYLVCAILSGFLCWNAYNTHGKWVIHQQELQHHNHHQQLTKNYYYYYSSNATVRQRNAKAATAASSSRSSIARLATRTQDEAVVAGKEEEKAAEAVEDAKDNNNNNKSTNAAAAAAVVDNVVVDKTIRKWGCDLQLHPYVFVHIGKAGGGGARARMSASAISYNRYHFRRNVDDKAYYPVQIIQQQPSAEVGDGTAAAASTNTTNVTIMKARFCNSGAKHFFPDVAVRSFEGSLLCGASTPISKAMACPFNSMECCDDVNSNPKDNLIDRVNACGSAVVSAGHTLLGSEMHWLPPNYLIDWWTSTYLNNRSSGISDSSVSSAAGAKILEGFELLNSNQFCDGNYPSHGMFRKYSKSYEKCHKPKESAADQLAYSYFSSSINNVTDWSGVYASMPVLRTTMVRDPWSWLISKFFWHGHQRWTACDDVKNATMYSGRTQVPASEIFEERGHARGWATRYALQYVLALCGEDCRSRLHLGQIQNLNELEIQAEGNLRRSFAVVGLINETDTFYDMIDARVAYMDMSLNPEVKGEKHGSGRKKGKDECVEAYKKAEFRSEMLAASPELAALNRLFRVAEEVNRFQLQDLRSCNTALDAKLKKNEESSRVTKTK